MFHFCRATALALILGAAASPALAQYTVVPYGGTVYTDVVVNGVPQSLANVRAFEQRCGIRAVSGRWWRDTNGNIGPVGRSATYNVGTCRAVTAGATRPTRDYARNWTQTTSRGSCTFFGTGGSICR